MFENYLQVIRTYVDIDECLVNNGGCESICTNLEGINNTTGLGYQCRCEYGYHLAPDNHDCYGDDQPVGSFTCTYVCTYIPLHYVHAFATYRYNITYCITFIHTTCTY